MQQTATKLLLVKPTSFGYNEETALSNSFQNKINEPAADIRHRALQEFQGFVDKLKQHHIGVLAFEDASEPAKPDAVFPNNWISMHADGTMVLYPMQAANRRMERSAKLIDELKSKFQVSRVLDLTSYENSNQFLEGTGSIVFDHPARLAYACRSPRTDATVLHHLCEEIGYTPVIFDASNERGIPIYHTNVMMCVAPKFAVICLESISDENERKRVEDFLSGEGHEIIDIRFDQMDSFAGNMLAVHNDEGTQILVMSQSAFDALSSGQRAALEKYCTLLPMNVKTIETVEGGSARCMIAEIFSEEKPSNP